MLAMPYQIIVELLGPISVLIHAVNLFCLGIEVSLSCLAECLEYGKWYLFITKLPEAIAATVIGIMLSVPLAAARLWGMVSFRWRRLEW